MATSDAQQIEAITFDWYGTLATNRQKIGRGKLFSQYLASCGLRAAPWEHRMLYDVFEHYGAAYKPGLSIEEKRLFWVEFAKRLFHRAQVSGCTTDEMPSHAVAIRDIFGSGAFELYADVRPVLNILKQRDMRLAIISNWPRGLDCFCHEMDVSHFFDTVISSAEIGFEKPDPRIFGEAVRRLGLDPRRVIHVGDTVDEDIVGAVGAGIRAILIDRHNIYDGVKDKIGSLYALEAQLSPE
jgi:HAD superfamily hydrolase (TIGR01549 family)